MRHKQLAATANNPRILALVSAVCIGLAHGFPGAEIDAEHDSLEEYYEAEVTDREGDNDRYTSNYALNDGYWSHEFIDTIYPHGYTYYRWDDQKRRWAEAATDPPSEGKSDRDSLLNGTVDGFKRVTLSDAEGVSSDHAFVKISLEEGGSRILSLGENLEMGDLELKKGDRLSASGRLAEVDGRKVLFAERILVDGDPIKASGKALGSTLTLQGELQDASRVTLGKYRRPGNLLVRFVLKDGSAFLADLGDTATLRDLSLDRGDTVWIKGRSRKIGEQVALVARKIEVDGHRQDLRSKIERPLSDSPSTDRR